METIDTGCAVSCRSANRHSHVNRSGPTTHLQVSLENPTFVARRLITLSLTVQTDDGLYFSALVWNCFTIDFGTHDQKYSLIYQVALNSIQSKRVKISIMHADFYG